MKRREFPKRVKVAAYERAAGKCESCGSKLAAGNVEYDHALEDTFGGEPTLDNCRVLCKSCHKSKSADRMTVIAKSNRVRAKHIGAATPKRNKIPGGKDDKYKRTVDGRTVLR